jgi:hypothetical protein
MLPVVHLSRRECVVQTVIVVRSNADHTHSEVAAA